LKSAPDQIAIESALAATAKADDTPVQQQLPGIEPPRFAAKWPKPCTLADDVLRRLLTGERLTQPSYGFVTWRLAAHIQKLEGFGWYIEATDVPSPPSPSGTRSIRMYWLSKETINAASNMGRA
jgi:hypothetical protein